MPCEIQSAPPLPPASQNWRLTLAYDGTDFYGWQVQPGKPTVQGKLQEALRCLTGEGPLPQGSGRTDAGVHALGQVASFALAAPIPAANLQRALNRTLPGSIRVVRAEVVPPSFHARHSALAKTYEYRLFTSDLCPPWLSRFVYASSWPMNMAAVEAAAHYFLGEQDFTSFAASEPDLSTRNQEAASNEEPVKGCVRTIFASAWERREIDAGPLLVYRVRGSGFLHHMVRNLVGTMLDIGRGHLTCEQIPQIFAARNRARAGQTAPARGLFLHSVEYEPASATSGN